MSGAWDGLGVEAVLLDADDTLYDTRSAMHRAGAEAATRLWPDADPERLAAAGVRFRDDPEGHFAAYARGETDFAQMRRARLGELAAWLGQPDGEWSAPFDAAYEPAFLDALEAFDDARPAVEALRAQGVLVGVLTNSAGDYTRSKLEAAGLDDLFDVVCSRDTLGFGKPDPRAFHEVARRLGADPSRTGYVGDELGTDPLGAVGAGMPAAWLVRDGEPGERELRTVAQHGVPVVRSLAEIAGLRGS